MLDAAAASAAVAIATVVVFVAAIVAASHFAWEMESSQSTSFFLFDHLK